MQSKNAYFPAMGKISVKSFPLAPKERHFCFFVFLTKSIFLIRKEPFNAGTHFITLETNIQKFLSHSCQLNYLSSDHAFFVLFF